MFQHILYMEFRTTSNFQKQQVIELLWQAIVSRIYDNDPDVSIMACVTSVSVGFGSKRNETRNGFWCFACAENGARAKEPPPPPSPFVANPTETLATQAMSINVGGQFFHTKTCLRC